MIPFRNIASMLAAALALGVAGDSIAQDYPSKPIRLVVSTSAGGPTDTLARVVGERLAEAWKQTVVVENKPDSNLVIGTTFVAKAPPDGYTLLVTAESPLTMLPHVMDKLPYDPLKSFEPVSTLAVAYEGIVVNAQEPSKTLPELLAAAKAAPGKYAYGAGNLGPRVGIERLSLLSGTKFLHVPYKGGAPVSAALMSGEINLSLTAITTSISPHMAGRLRILAVSGDKRLSALPEVPTLGELGYPGFSGTWLALLAPAGTPRAIVMKISDQVNKILAQPDVQERLTKLGLEAFPNTPDRTKSLIGADSEKWGRVITQTGVTLKE